VKEIPEGIVWVEPNKSMVRDPGASYLSRQSPGSVKSLILKNFAPPPSKHANEEQQPAKK
jgi:hypothetical protein